MICSCCVYVSDLPDLVRFRYRNNISEFNLRGQMDRQVDIPRLRAGKVGGFFWSVYVECEVGLCFGWGF